MADMESWFHITDLDTAIYDTIQDAHSLQCLILDISPEADLDKMFRPLDNCRSSEMHLGKEKAKGRFGHGHTSWLRLYALKLEPGAYLIYRGLNKTYEDDGRAETYVERTDETRDGEKLSY